MAMTRWLVKQEPADYPSMQTPRYAEIERLLLPAEFRGSDSVIAS